MSRITMRKARDMGVAVNFYLLSKHVSIAVQNRPFPRQQYHCLRFASTHKETARKDAHTVKRQCLRTPHVLCWPSIKHILRIVMAVPSFNADLRLVSSSALRALRAVGEGLRGTYFGKMFGA